jgi:hypothetical protein
MIRQWVIVARDNVRLFEALAGAFWHRREFSVVLDRRGPGAARRSRERGTPRDRRLAPPLELVAEQFCIVNADIGRSAAFDDTFPP